MRLVFETPSHLSWRHCNDTYYRTLKWVQCYLKLLQSPTSSLSPFHVIRTSRAVLLLHTVLWQSYRGVIVPYQLIGDIMIRRLACKSSIYIYIMYVYIYIYIYIHTYIHTYMFVVNFDSLAQASDIRRIERRQVVFLCWMQDSNLEVSRHLSASRLNAHSQTDWTIEAIVKYHPI